MKTAKELIDNFSKGSTKFTISEKQLNWLKSLSRKEGRLTDLQFNTSIQFDDCYYTVNQCKRLASGGSYVGTKLVQGKYILEVYFYVRFKDTGICQVFSKPGLDRIQSEGYQFDILSPLEGFAQ